MAETGERAMRGFDDCPLCLGSGAQCEPCQNRRLLAADEHTRLWSDEITGSITAGGQTGHEPDENGSDRA